MILDNGSTDGTAEYVRNGCPISGGRVRHILEPRRGVARARNAALRNAAGEIILFLDDDTRPNPQWLDAMCSPIRAGHSAGVVGAIRIPPYLQRPWMTSRHRAWLASTELLDVDNPQGLITANMALSREVLEKVPGFDEELGSGALGFWEDSLFSFQLKRAGYRFALAPDASVEHHFDASRLSRTSFLDRAAREGRSRAYVAHHWEHRTLSSPRKQAARLGLQLAKRRIIQRKAQSEGAPEWEMELVMHFHLYRQYLIERKRPHNYDAYGLVKRTP